MNSFTIIPFTATLPKPAHWWLHGDEQTALRASTAAASPASALPKTVPELARRMGLPSETSKYRIARFFAHRQPHVLALSASAKTDVERDQEVFARNSIGADSLATALWISPKVMMADRAIRMAIQALINTLPLVTLRQLVPYEPGLRATALSATVKPTEQSEFLDRSKIALTRIAAVLKLKLDPEKDADLLILGALEQYRDVAPSESLEMLLTRGPNKARFS